MQECYMEIHTIKQTSMKTETVCMPIHYALETCEDSQSQVLVCP